MKAKLYFLFIIAGGILASQTYSLIPLSAVVISLIGGFLLGFSYMLFSSIYGGKVWGIKIKSKSGAIKTICGIIGGIIGGYCLLITGLVIFTSLFAFDLVELGINLVAFVATLIVGPMIAKIVLEKTLAKEDYALVLSKLPLFKEIDENIGNAAYFVVGFEGVALFSEADYCYAVYRYENYQLGELVTPDQVALVGSYFVQKYSDRYTFKVDVEVIPGEPGKTVLVVGAGGVNVGRIKGTPDQRLFRSYIFTKK